MTDRRKPTAEQLNELSSLGIIPSEQRGTCAAMLEFIREGNGAAHGNSPEDRTALVLRAQQDWLDRDVVITTPKVFQQPARVTHFVARPRLPMQVVLGCPKRVAEHKATHPLFAVVKVTDGKAPRTKRVPVETLQLAK